MTGTETPRPARTARRLLTAAAVSVGAVIVSAVPAFAQTPTVPPERQARIEAACARVPALQTAVQKRLDRIQGDASVTGSIAWLQEARAKAEAANRTQVVATIDQRITVRTNLVPLLEQRQDRLAEVAAKCVELGL